jgi:hypothetical protein
LGLKLFAGFSAQTIERTCAVTTNHERFKDGFNASPKTVEDILRDIQSPDLGDTRITNPKPSLLLPALHFFKKHPTKHGLAAFRDSTLKERITGHKTRAEEDEALFLHDMTFCTLAEDLPGCWEGSAAQRLLRKDIKRKHHLRMKPELLRLRRPEHQEFGLEQFRKHIYQETRTAKETPYWTCKKKKKEMRAAAAAQNDEQGDENLDFFDDPVLQMQII